MKRKRMFGVLLMVLILSASSVFVYAKTDEATRSFKLKGLDVSGSAEVSISTGAAGFNTAVCGGKIEGSDLLATTYNSNYTNVELITYCDMKNYKMYGGKTKGKVKITGYCMWKATMKIYQETKKLAAWTVCCS